MNINLEYKPALVIKMRNYYVYICQQSMTGQFIWSHNGQHFVRGESDMCTIISDYSLQFWEFDTVEEAENFINTMVELERK